jgi:membrane-anchored protein YejM (alkaline phosphatase superfamily)
LTDSPYFSFASYISTKSACEKHQSSLAELQRQLQSTSQYESEVANLREAIQRVVAEKERYKVRLGAAFVFTVVMHGSGCCTCFGFALHAHARF